MPDRERVIKGLEYLHDRELWKEGFMVWEDKAEERREITGNALALLREQEVGKWIKLQGMAPPEYHGHKICSVCESFAPYDPIHPWREMLSPYCPGCGAKMEVSGDD